MSQPNDPRDERGRAESQRRDQGGGFGRKPPRSTDRGRSEDRDRRDVRGSAGDADRRNRSGGDFRGRGPRDDSDRRGFRGSGDSRDYRDRGDRNRDARDSGDRPGRREFQDRDGRPRRDFRSSGGDSYRGRRDVGDSRGTRDRRDRDGVDRRDDRDRSRAPRGDVDRREYGNRGAFGGGRTSRQDVDRRGYGGRDDRAQHGFRRDSDRRDSDRRGSDRRDSDRRDSDRRDSDRRGFRDRDFRDRDDRGQRTFRGDSGRRDYRDRDHGSRDDRRERDFRGGRGPRDADRQGYRREFPTSGRSDADRRGYRSRDDRRDYREGGRAGENNRFQDRAGYRDSDTRRDRPRRDGSTGRDAQDRRTDARRSDTNRRDSRRGDTRSPARRDRDESSFREVTKPVPRDDEHQLTPTVEEPVTSPAGDTAPVATGEAEHAPAPSAAEPPVRSAATEAEPGAAIIEPTAHAPEASDAEPGSSAGTTSELVDARAVTGATDQAPFASGAVPDESPADEDDSAVDAGAIVEPTTQVPAVPDAEPGGQEPGVSAAERAEQPEELDSSAAAAAEAGEIAEPTTLDAEPDTVPADHGAPVGEAAAENGEPVGLVRNDSRERAPRPRDDEPELLEEIQFSDLDPEARRELRSLAKSTAELVGRHLVAAGRLIDDDPELALQHARFARTRAARVPLVREAAGLAAYHAGQWAEALGELRAVRRMSGGQAHLPVMADCERALGRPERALELAAEAPELPKDVAIELKIVTAGARRDMGQLDAAVVALQGPDLDPALREPWSPRLFYAYADNLEAAGRTEDAIRWFLNAAEADIEEETDAAERAFALREAE